MIEISVNEVKRILESEFFLSKNEERFNFLPSDFWDWALKSNINVSVYDIEKWGDFEYGRIDFDETDFGNLVFGQREYTVNANVLFTSDESLKKKIAFRFKVDDFQNFVNYYERTFNMGFFQPLDYIVYIEECKEIKIIHHEGKLIKISPSAEN